VNNLHTQHFSSSLIRFSSSESDSEVLLVFVSGLTDGQSCQAIDSFLRGVYINVGEILNSDWEIRESPCLIFTKWLQCDQYKH
jgi:hypothetical protein